MPQPCFQTHDLHIDYNLLLFIHQAHIECPILGDAMVRKVGSPHGNALVFWSFTIADSRVGLLLFVLLGLSGFFEFLDSCIFFFFYHFHYLFRIDFFSLSPFRFIKIPVKPSHLVTFSRYILKFTSYLFILCLIYCWTYLLSFKSQLLLFSHVDILFDSVK